MSNSNLHRADLDDINLDEFEDAIDQSLASDPGTVINEQSPNVEPQASQPGTQVATQRMASADSLRDSLYKGTSNVIDKLEGQRDAVADTLRTELNARLKRSQEELEYIEAEKAKALEVVKINSEYALKIRTSMDLDQSETNQKIADETTKFNEMISGQRVVLEHLR